MKPLSKLQSFSICLLALFVACPAIAADKSKKKKTDEADSTVQIASKYKTDDNRTIDIGKHTSADGGLRFKEPHMDKCWIAEGFNFNGYDTLYIAPTMSAAKFHNDEGKLHDWAKETLPTEFSSYITRRGVFAHVVTKESEIKPGAKVLKLENTITEYSKGGGAGRYFAGIYGGGQPNLRVVGKMTDGDKTVFNFEARRSGASVGGRLNGGFMKDEDVQIEDIRSMSLDLSDFIAAVAGKYTAK